jgi:hypothetical protein
VRCCAPKSGGTGGSGSGGGSGGGPSCVPGKSTRFALDIKLPGIGNDTFDNHAPAHPQRHAAIEVKDNAGNPVFGSSHDFSRQISHGAGNGHFGTAAVDLATQLTCGKTYTVSIKVPGYLPATATVTYGAANQVLPVELIPGDINGVNTTGVIVGDGKIGVEDYRFFADNECGKDVDPDKEIPFTSGSTTVNLKCRDLINFIDYPDGGTNTANPDTGVDEWAANYNVWLRGYLKANGL